METPVRFFGSMTFYGSLHRRQQASLKIVIEEVDSMRRLIFLTLFILSAGCLLAAAQQQNSPTTLRGELRKMLSLPAPTPRVADEAEKRGEKPPRPTEFYDKAKTPSDDAPVADLLDYWERHASFNDPKPSEATRQRLLAACKGEPERVSRLLNLLPQDSAAVERVKKLYDEALAMDRFDEDWRKSVRDWLRFNSKYFIGELLALARKAKDKEGYVDNEKALLALAKVDWHTAEPLLQNLSSGGPRTAALATALLYRHVIEAKEEGAAGRYRKRLMTIAASRSLPAAARDTAIEELSISDWPGRDEWYLSFLAGETLLEPSDGEFIFSPLTTHFDRQPDKWIPVMAKMVESQNRATQPSGYSTFDESSFEIEQDDFPNRLNDHLAQAVAGDFVALARSSEEGGLWKKSAGKKPERLSRAGIYANPLVTPDGKWAVAAKTDSNWGRPNYVVRFNLQTRGEYRVNLPPADQFDSVSYVAAHNKVLLRRARDEENKSSGPEEPEFYLLDVATGRTQKVTGEFAPLLQEGPRSLQPTGKSFEYWAAIPDREKNRTRVGRYNSRDFSFQTALDAPQLTFDSFSMWVDEKEAKLLVVYKGQLLRLPLRE